MLILERTPDAASTPTSLRIISEAATPRINADEPDVNAATTPTSRRTTSGATRINEGDTAVNMAVDSEGEQFPDCKRRYIKLTDGKFNLIL